MSTHQRWHRHGRSCQRIYDNIETLRRAQIWVAVIRDHDGKWIGAVGLRDERSPVKNAAVGIEQRIRRAGRQTEGQCLCGRVRIGRGVGDAQIHADIDGAVRHRRQNWRGVCCRNNDVDVDGVGVRKACDINFE